MFVEAYLAWHDEWNDPAQVRRERDIYLDEIKRRDKNLNGCPFCKGRRDAAIARADRMRGSRSLAGDSANRSERKKEDP